MPAVRHKKRTFDDLNVLYLHHTQPDYITPPSYSRRQFVAGPFMQTDPAKRTLATPSGSYDLVSVMRNLPASDQPDVVIVWADATCSNLPGNLSSVRATKILMVGDTHHLSRPLQNMISYATSEPFDLVVFSHNRHHAHFFMETGLTKLAWFPSCEGNPPVSPFPPLQRRNHIVASGQAGQYHPRRSRMLAALQEAALPLSSRNGPPEVLRQEYADAALAFNCSLNGDLNLRVMEVLAAGGCLLTDRLGPQAGLLELFEDGRDLITYGDEREAVEQARILLANPERALAIARRGWQRYIFEVGFTAQRRSLFTFLDRGEIRPGSAFSNDVRCRATSLWHPPSLADRIPLYEYCQETNRIRESSVVGLDKNCTLPMLLDLYDLHRTRLLIEDGPTASALRCEAHLSHVLQAVTIAPSADFRRSSLDLLVLAGTGSTSACYDDLRMEQSPRVIWHTMAAGSSIPDGYHHSQLHPCCLVTDIET